VPLRIIAGKLEIREREISFRCTTNDNDASIDCIISCQALRDLAIVYSLTPDVSDLAAFEQLLSQIERIASRKYEKAGSKQSGHLKIGTADLLRYGFPRGPI